MNIAQINDADINKRIRDKINNNFTELKNAIEQGGGGGSGKETVTFELSSFEGTESSFNTVKEAIDAGRDVVIVDDNLTGHVTGIYETEYIKRFIVEAFNTSWGRMVNYEVAFVLASNSVDIMPDIAELLIDISSKNVIMYNFFSTSTISKFNQIKNATKIVCNYKDPGNNNSMKENVTFYGINAGGKYPNAIVGFTMHTSIYDVNVTLTDNDGDFTATFDYGTDIEIPVAEDETPVDMNVANFKRLKNLVYCGLPFRLKFENNSKYIYPSYVDYQSMSKFYIVGFNDIKMQKFSFILYNGMTEYEQAQLTIADIT